MASAIQHGVQSSTLADVLERVLDKGVVVAGDIRVRIADIELIAIQIRLIVCSVDKAREMGMDWWVNNPTYHSPKMEEAERDSLAKLAAALERVERRLDRLDPSPVPPLLAPVIAEQTTEPGELEVKMK